MRRGRQLNRDWETAFVLESKAPVDDQIVEEDAASSDCDGSSRRCDASSAAAGQQQRTSALHSLRRTEGIPSAWGVRAAVRRRMTDDLLGCRSTEGRGPRLLDAVTG